MKFFISNYETKMRPYFVLLQLEDDDTFAALFHRIQSGAICTIVPSEHLVNSVLDKVLVGQSRDAFSVVEATHSVIGVCSMFGSFVKFVVTNSSSETDEMHQSKRRRLEDPIEPTRCLPPYISPEKNKQDKLYNAVLQALSDEGLGWIDPLKYGKVFITDLCKLLWLIDGHHNVISSRSCHIPLLFSKFVGYNRLELSKHRRRSISNMNRDKLLEHAATLQDYATSS